ncbi:hypothetical protein GF325_18525 [Candidatus Bathyarchaeota archaeon]|nr:hypothetical protein [Candidatus Bathyarchaeota archaeon]
MIFFGTNVSGQDWRNGDPEQDPVVLAGRVIRDASTMDASKVHGGNNQYTSLSMPGVICMLMHHG